MVDDSNGSCSVGLVSHVRKWACLNWALHGLFFVGFSAGGSLAAFHRLSRPLADRQGSCVQVEMFKGFKKDLVYSITQLLFFVDDIIAVQFRLHSYIAYKFDGDLMVYWLVKVEDRYWIYNIHKNIYFAISDVFFLNIYLHGIHLSNPIGQVV